MTQRDADLATLLELADALDDVRALETKVIDERNRIFRRRRRDTTQKVLAEHARCTPMNVSLAQNAPRRR